MGTCDRGQRFAGTARPEVRQGAPNARGDPQGRRAPMIGLDTNVIVRYLTRDDPAQTRLADSAAGCDVTVTFDRDLRNTPGFRLL